MKKYFGLFHVFGELRERVVLVNLKIFILGALWAASGRGTIWGESCSKEEDSSSFKSHEFLAVESSFAILHPKVVDLVLKYTASGTSMAFNRIKDPALKFPDLFLCPKQGFKKEEISGLSDVSENPWRTPETLSGSEKVNKQESKMFHKKGLYTVVAGVKKIPIFNA